MDILASCIVVAMGVAIFFVATMRAPEPERSYVRVALCVHYAFAFALYAVFEYLSPVSDVRGYIASARPLVLLIEARPERWLVEIAKSFVFLPNDLPRGEGSTGNMVSVTAIGLVVTGSPWAMFPLYATVSFLGKWALYAAARDELKWRDARPLAIATMLVPSCVFWTSGLVKEAFAVGGLGALVRGAQLIFTKPSLAGLLLTAYGVILVAAFKPYLLLPFMVAAGLWFVFAKVRRAPEFAVIVIVAGLFVGVAGVALVGDRFREYSLDNVTQSIARGQQLGAVAGGGSAYTIASGESDSAGGQALFAPLALLTTLARPLPFEVHNAISAIASAEVTVLTVLIVGAIWRLGLGRSLRAITSNPFVTFAATFVLVGAIGVGLATTNFGTLSRYRAPLIPLYALIIVTLRHAVPSAAPARRAPPPSALALAARRRMQRSQSRNEVR